MAARKTGPRKFRVRGALVLMLIWLILIIGSRTSTSPAELGRNLFATLAGVTLAVCLLAGAFLTADCLSEEKREGTIGLLFLTDLKGYDVVLGKLAATSLNSFYGLLAIFPILALPMLLGGVSGAEFGRVMLALLVTLLFSLASGLAVSALSRESRAAAAGTLGLVLLLALIVPVLYGILAAVCKSGTRSRWCGLARSRRIRLPSIPIIISAMGLGTFGPHWALHLVFRRYSCLLRSKCCRGHGRRKNWRLLRRENAGFSSASVLAMSARGFSCGQNCCRQNRFTGSPPEIAFLEYWCGLFLA